MVNEFEGFWDNTPDINLPVTKTTKHIRQKSKHSEPRLIQPIGPYEDCYKVLNPLDIWLKKDKNLIVLRRVIDNVLIRICSYEEQWNNNSNNLFPVDLLRCQIKDQDLEEFLRNDRRTFELLNTKYNQGGIRNYPQWIEDFKSERSQYIKNHPWPLIALPIKLNLQNNNDIESICIVVSYCHDLLYPTYPIFTDEQKKKLKSLQYPTYQIYICLIDNYISHMKCYIDEIKTKSKLLEENNEVSDLSNKKQAIVKKKNATSIIVGIVVFLAALFTCIGYFLEWFEPIKVFIYSLFEKIKGFL